MDAWMVGGGGLGVVRERAPDVVVVVVRVEPLQQFVREALEKEGRTAWTSLVEQCVTSRALCDSERIAKLGSADEL